MNTYRCRYLTIYLLCGLALLLSSCGGAPSTQVAPSPSPASAGETDSPDPTQLAATLTAQSISDTPQLAIMTPGPVLPVDVESQIVFVPGRPGGNGDEGSCYDDPAREAAKDPQPEVYASLAKIDIGASLVICYFALPPGPVTAQIFAPDGMLIQTLEFIVASQENANTMEIKEYMALPGDKPGIYRVVAKAQNITKETTFEVTDQNSPSLKNYMIKFLGRGPDTLAINGIEYIALNGFAPNDTVDLLFYVACTPDDRIRNMPVGDVPPDLARYARTYTYAIKAQVKVDTNGSTLVRLPDGLKSQLNPGTEYIIEPHGTHPLPTRVEPLPSDTVLLHTNPDMTDQAQITCPIPPNVVIPTPPAPTEARQTLWTLDATSADSPEIQMAGGIVYINTGEKIYAIDPGSGKQVWSVDLEAGINGSYVRATAAGIVFVGHYDGHVLGLDGRTGDLLWDTKLTQGTAETILRMTAAPDGDAAYIATLTGSKEYVILSKLDLSSGKIIARTPIGTNRSPQWIMQGQDLYALGADGGFSNTPAFLSIDAGTMKVKWFLTSHEDFLWPPDLNTNQVFVQTKDNQTGEYQLYALEGATGKEQWHISLQSLASLKGTATTVFLRYNSNAETPPLVAVNVATGQQRWAYQTGTTDNGYGVAALTIGDGVVYASNEEGTLLTLDEATGQIRWKFKTESTLSTAAAVAGDTLYLGGDDGYLYALDKATGKPKWRYKTEGLASITQPPLITGDTIIFVSGYMVYAIR